RRARQRPRPAPGPGNYRLVVRACRPRRGDLACQPAYARPAAGQLRPRHRLAGGRGVLARRAGRHQPAPAARTVRGRISSPASGRGGVAGMTTLDSPARRRHGRRPLGSFVALLMLALALLAACFAVEWDWVALTDAQHRAEAAARMGAWLAAFLSPDLSAEFLLHSWDLTLQTLSAAVLGTALAVLFAWPLAMGASRAVCVGEERGGFLASRLPQGNFLQRHFPLRSPAALLCAACRLLQDILRAVPDFVWAIILVAMIGLGPLTGALALALNITGILAKVYSELWDGVDETRYAQVRSQGGGRLATFLYGIRPLASRNVLSFTLMRAECAIRNAAVIGAVGGGGLGSEIWYQIRFGAWDKVGTLMLFTLLLTLSADVASNYIRRLLRHDIRRTSHSRAPRGAWYATGCVVAVLVWSLWFMGWGNRAGEDGAPRNHLAPAAELLTGQAWQNLTFFSRLLSPELDLPAIGIGPEEVVAKRHEAGTVVELFANYGPSQFLRSEAWTSWLEQLRKWFVWRVIESAAVPLAIAIVGTVLGIAATILLTYPHSATFQLLSARFTGEVTPAWLKVWRTAVMSLARATAMIARGVPEVMWAFLLIAFFGPGLVAGALAIALHTLGVMTRMFGEAVDNQPLHRFEPTCGASRPTTY